MLPGRRQSLPTHLAISIWAITVVPVAAVLCVGWLLLRQERMLEDEQAREHLTQGTASIVSALQRSIDTSWQRLERDPPDLPAGAVALVERGGVPDIHPASALPFVPVAPRLPQITVTPAGGGPADEEEGAEPVPTATTAGNTEGRVAATLRVANAHLAAGRLPAALEVYGSLREVNEVAVLGGAPLALFARAARCEVLQRLNRSSLLRQEAQDMLDMLASGRWRVDWPVYRSYRDAAFEWGAVPTAEQTQAELLAAAIDEFWSSRGTLLASGATSIIVGGSPVMVLWNQAPSPRMLLATPRVVEDQWLQPARDVAAAQNLTFVLGDHPSSEGAPAISSVVRTDATGLPWSISVTLSNGARRVGFAPRRQLLAVGVLLLACMTLAASTVTVRAVKKEMSIAQLQSDFVAAVSHEFRTPLTSLRQFTDMLRENRTRDEERRQLCYEAQSRATNRLSRLVESLLDFGRMEAGEQRYRFDEVEISAFVQAVVSEFRQHLESAGCTLSVDPGPSTLVRADKESLSRVIWNLLENAVKYSPESCAVHAVVRREHDQVHVEIRDNGFGIPEHEQQTIFHKFRRGEEAIRRGIKGTGLGLAMVREIMRAHGGHVGVISSGSGSVFTLTLPVRG